MFPGDWPQRNNEEVQQAEWRGRGNRSLDQRYTHPLRHLPPTPEHTGYVRVSISHQLEHISYPNIIQETAMFFYFRPSHFKEEFYFFFKKKNTVSLFPSTCHLCLSGAAFISHWPQGPWCVITEWPLTAPFLIPVPPLLCVTALPLPITCTHAHVAR